MRKVIVACLALAAVLGLAGIWSATAQTNAGANPGEKSEEAPRNFIVVAADQLSGFPDDFRDRDVQVADYYGETVSSNKYPGELKQYGITPKTYFGFTTHRAVGSNMICFVKRDNKEAQDFFNTPLPPETAIYMMGRVGAKLVSDYGVMPVMLVERVFRGSAPPAEPKEQRPKSVKFLLEWQTDKGTASQTYTIPEPGKRYKIEDPYDRRRALYMTFEF